MHSKTRPPCRASGLGACKVRPEWAEAPLTGTVERSRGREMERDPQGRRGDLVSASTGSRHTQRGKNDVMGQIQTFGGSLDQLVCDDEPAWVANSYRCVSVKQTFPDGSPGRLPMAYVPSITRGSL